MFEKNNAFFSTTISDVFKKKPVSSAKLLCVGICQNSAGSIAAYKDLYQAADNKGIAEGLAYEKETTYVVTDVRERMGAFLATLGGKK